MLDIQTMRGEQAARSDPRFSSLFRDASYVTCLVTPFLLGAIYITPLFTAGLKEDFQLDTEVIVLAGVCSLAGLGSLQFPSIWLLKLLEKRGWRQKELDRFASVVESSILVVGLTLIGVFLHVSKKSGGAPSTGGLTFAYFLWGGGSGTSFKSVISIATTNTRNEGRHSWQVRSASALLSFSFGVGGVFWSVMYYFWWRQLESVGIPGTLFIFAALNALNGVFRFAFAYTRPCTIQVAAKACAESMASASTLKSTSRCSTSSLCCSSVVWATCTMAGSCIGLGSAFISEIEVLATLIAQGTLDGRDSDLDAQAIAIVALLLAMSANAVGRLLTFGIYSFCNTPFLLSGWALILLFGFLLLTFYPTVVALYVSSFCIGLAFGGAWGTFPVLVAVDFPSGSSVSSGIASVFFALAILTLFYGQVANVLLENNAAQISEYFDAYLFLSAFSTATVLGTLWLICALRKARSNSAAM